MNQQITPAQPRDYHDVITKVASTKDVDVDKLERLMKLQEEWEKRQAATHYNNMMSAAQGEMERISKDSANPITRSRYASLEKLDEAVRPIYTRYGFSISFNDETPHDRPDWLRLVAYISNGSETRTFTKWIPVSTTGIRGQQAMTPTHASIASVTYGRRALLKMIFNLAEEDTDGNLAGRMQSNRMETPLTEEQQHKAEVESDSMADQIIETMRGFKDHNALYGYRHTKLADLWKDIFPPDRERIGAAYKELMTKFAEAVKQ
jgi:hypothetical protein